MTQRCMGCMELFGEEYTVCPHCGYAVGTQAEVAVHMEPGTVLHDRYIVGRVLGFGGFGVTYLGWDGKLEQKVAIKEYLPNEFSTRMPGKTMLTVFEGEKSEQFHDGMRKFTDEARRLAKFQNEDGIVKVYDSFEENCTAYIIMEYLEGETLTAFLEREKTIPEDRAVEMLKPVMKSLQVVHAAGILHRDIAPDNIFLTKSGEVKLIDFGASRYATTSHSRSLTVIIKPGYSPEEQYRSSGDQGPHTDVYALAATMYKMITGKTPPDAMERRAAMESKNKDILVDPRKLNKDISVNRENAILNALNVRIEDRTPNVPEFMKELEMDPPAKRRYGAIKRLNFYAWPLWLKVLIPTALVAVAVFGVLLLTGVIRFSKYKKEVVKPDGIVIAPDVEGLTYEEAISAIEGRRLIPVVEGSLASEYITAGTIVKQTPIGGAFLQENGEVRLLTSSGTKVKAPVNGVATVPFVVGDTQEAAAQKFLDAGLAEPEIRLEYNEVIAEGLVVSSELAAEKTTAEGSKLYIVVSQGPAPFDMPDVVGKMEAEGKQILLDNKLTVVPEYENSDLPVGQIIRQNPEAGEQVKRGNSVTIVVSSGKKIVTVPDVVGKTQEEATKELEDAGFSVFVAENNDEEVPVGNVISQTPEAGTSQEEGSTITIMVSKGKRDITVSYDLAGGKMGSGEKIVHLGEEYGELPTPKRDGFTFDGWYTKLADGSTVRIKSDSIVEADGDSIALTAAWREVAATATPTPKPTNTPTPRPTNTPTQKPNTPTPTNTPKPNTPTPTSLPEYKVTYDANGGIGAPDNQTKKHGVTLTLSGDEPTLTGNTFLGWATERGSTTVVYSKGASYSENADLILYAVWSKNSYYLDVNFKLDNGEVSGKGNGYCTFDVYVNGALSASAVEDFYQQLSYGSSYEIKNIAATSGHIYIGVVSGQLNGTIDAEAQKVVLEFKTTYIVQYNANGGKGIPGNQTKIFGDSLILSSTKPTRDYYNFKGWATSANGTVAYTAGNSYTANAGVTLYAVWEQKPISSWVLESSMPSGAQVVNRKWTYDLTETQESTNASVSGWTQTGSYWKQTGSGSTNYASFPSTFDTGNSIYTSFAKGPYTASETASTKRTVSNTHKGYVYWHWMYSVAYANTTQRTISDRYGYFDDKGFYYFSAFLSSVACPYLDNYYCLSRNLPSYNCANVLPSTGTGVGTPRYFRFEYYQSTYTDYQKMYQYSRKTSKESTTQVTAGGNISNVKVYVQYREK